MSEAVVEPRTYEYVCDARTASRILRVLMRRTRIFAYVEFGFAVVITLLNLATDDQSWFVVLLLVLAGATFLWQTRGSRFRATLGEGKRLTSAFSDSDVAFSNALASSRIPYASFASVQAKRDVVFFKLKGSRCRYGHPVEVFPLEEVERVRAAASLSNG